MTKKKVKEIEIDEKSSEFVAFKKLFNYRASPDKKSFIVTSTSSCISDEVVAEPPHYEIAFILFPEASAKDMIAFANEVYAKAQTYLDDVQDFYETHYPEYTFDINFVDLYRIYLKHQ